MDKSYESYKNQPPECSTTQATGQLSLLSFLPPRSSLVSGSALNIKGWIVWVYVGLKPFPFIEYPVTRKCEYVGYTANVSSKKHMEKLTQQVEKKIFHELTSEFSLASNCWSQSSTHSIGLLHLIRVIIKMATVLFCWHFRQ